MSVAASLGLSLLGLFVLPVLVSGCLGDGRGGVPWYEARRDPTGLAPDPATTREAVIQVYAARAVSWRGVFSVHTWFAVKRTGAERFTRYEVLDFGVTNGTPAVPVNRTGPDNYWFGARPQIILDRRGPGVDANQFLSRERSYGPEVQYTDRFPAGGSRTLGLTGNSNPLPSSGESSARSTG